MKAARVKAASRNIPEPCRMRSWRMRTSIPRNLKMKLVKLTRNSLSMSTMMTNQLNQLKHLNQPK